jgi:two-component system chemotaxis response regulator CheB
MSLPIRVLVVDDSPLQRDWLTALLESDPQLEVAGWAAEGGAAVRAAAHLRPDVIAMDLRSPGMDGLETTRRIMRETPTPIVLVTAPVSAEDQRFMADALRAGVLAIEVRPADRVGARELLETIKGMSRVKVLRRTALGPVGAARWVGHRPRQSPELIAIGASTGGPQALKEVLGPLPATCPLPIVVVQHMSDGFAPNLVDWLRLECALPIHLARHGQPAQGPGVFIAPTGEHLTVSKRRLQLTGEAQIGGHRPSVTALFRSVAQEYGPAAVGVLLTGMGEDGAVGLAELKRAGGITVVQDEASCIVFGMPAAAVNLGAVDHILPPADIAGLLDRLTRPAGRT